MAAYVTEAEADAYMVASRLVTAAWDSADSATKTKALNIATNQIDRLNFTGDKYDADQDNQFPRGSDTTVPQDIKDACAEIAYSLVDGVDVEYEYENLGERAMGFANVRSSRDTSFVPQHKLARISSGIAWSMLIPYLRENALKLMRK